MAVRAVLNWLRTNPRLFWMIVLSAIRGLFNSRDRRCSACRGRIVKKYYQHGIGRHGLIYCTNCNNHLRQHLERIARKTAGARPA